MSSDNQDTESESMCSAENSVSISVALASTSKICLVRFKCILNTCDIGSQCWGLQLLLFICSTMFGCNICHTFLSQFSICSERSGLECLIWAEVMERAWRRWMMLSFNLSLSSHEMTQNKEHEEIVQQVWWQPCVWWKFGLPLRIGYQWSHYGQHVMLMFEVARYLQIISYVNLWHW